MLKYFSIVLALLAFAPATAAPTSASQITLVGIGLVETQPDEATLTFDVVGEGATVELATRALIAKNKAVEDGLSGVTAKLDVGTGTIFVKAVRGKECEGIDGDNSASLSTGDCAIQGYVARLSFVVGVSPAEVAGTAAGQAARFGANNAIVQVYSVSDPAQAKRRAEQLAVADAKARALAIAQGSGRSLGSLVRVEDPDDIMADTLRKGPVNYNPPPAVRVLPPIVVSTKPARIQTEARLLVTFELLP